MKPSAQVECVSGSRTTSQEVGNAGHRRFATTGALIEALEPFVYWTARAVVGFVSGFTGMLLCLLAVADHLAVIG